MFQTHLEGIKTPKEMSHLCFIGDADKEPRVVHTTQQRRVVCEDGSEVTTPPLMQAE